MALAEQRIPQLVDGLFGLVEADRCRLVLRGAGVSADQAVGFCASRKVLFDPRRDAERAAVLDRGGEDAEAFVQDGGGGRGFGEEAGEEGGQKGDSEGGLFLKIFHP